MGRIGVTRMLVTAGLGLAIVLPAIGQEFHRVRGVLEAIEGDHLSVSTRDGEVRSYVLSPDARFFLVRPADLDDVEAGAFVGVTSVETDGERIALETHVFAEELRGVGEGHFPWDLVEQPNTMTNATVAEVKGVGPDRQITVTYTEGPETKKTTSSQTITLPPDAPVVHLEPTDRRDLLVPGKGVLVWIDAPAAGTPTATMVVVGEEGTAPPM